MTIGNRILAGYAIVLTISTLASAGGIFAIITARNAYSEFIDTDSAMHQSALSLSVHAQLQSSSFRGYLLYRDPEMEQGNKAVEAGVQQAGTVGAAIQQLASSIAESAQSAAQIAASSQQQLAGMDQVALAMENISLASKQNAVGTGQAQSAAEDLKQLAERLRLLIEKGASVATEH